MNLTGLELNPRSLSSIEESTLIQKQSPNKNIWERIHEKYLANFFKDGKFYSPPAKVNNQNTTTWSSVVPIKSATLLPAPAGVISQNPPLSASVPTSSQSKDTALNTVALEALKRPLEEEQQKNALLQKKTQNVSAATPASSTQKVEVIIKKEEPETKKPEEPEPLSQELLGYAVKPLDVISHTSSLATRAFHSAIHSITKGEVLAAASEITGVGNLKKGVKAIPNAFQNGYISGLSNLPGAVAEGIWETTKGVGKGIKSLAVGAGGAYALWHLSKPLFDLGLSGVGAALSSSDTVTYAASFTATAVSTGLMLRNLYQIRKEKTTEGQVKKGCEALAYGVAGAVAFSPASTLALGGQAMEWTGIAITNIGAVVTTLSTFSNNKLAQASIASFMSIVSMQGVASKQQKIIKEADEILQRPTPADKEKALRDKTVTLRIIEENKKTVTMEERTQASQDKQNAENAIRNAVITINNNAATEAAVNQALQDKQNAENTIKNADRVIYSMVATPAQRKQHTLYNDTTAPSIIAERDKILNSKEATEEEKVEALANKRSANLAFTAARGVQVAIPAFFLTAFAGEAISYSVGLVSSTVGGIGSFLWPVRKL